MKIKKRVALIILSIVLLALSAVLAVCLGSISLPLKSIITAFFKDDKTARIIILHLRLPRVAAAALAGIGLASAGNLLQAVTDNELCAPNIIGVNSGAGFFMMLILCLFPSLWMLEPIAAFIGALFASFLVIFISYASRSRHQKSTLILSGVAVSSVFSAGISFLSIKFPDVLSSYTAFSVGGFSGVVPGQLILPAIIIFICLAAAMFIAPKLDILALGDDVAVTLGVSVKKIRIFTVVLASAMCAAVVSFAGLIGFVGLIVPHITRSVVGGNLRNRIPFTAIFGAILVIISDLLGRTLFIPGELPAGILMAFIGAPFFIYLLVRKRDKT